MPDKEFGSLGKGMPVFTVNSLVIGKQPENPGNPLFYITRGIPNPEEPESLKSTQVGDESYHPIRANKFQSFFVS
jgi:hypothetical protein